jgi:hypothetical protein
VTCLAGAAAPTVVPAPAQAPRSDGTVAHFVVDSVESFDKDVFPSERVYGPTPGPTLGLVTCGGAFDRGAPVLPRQRRGVRLAPVSRGS